MPETPPLEEIIKRAVRSEIARVHTQVPGRVLSYDVESKTVKVQLIVEHSYLDPDTGERTYYKPPPLVNVPVKFPAILTWPIAEGDPGWVEFAERSIDEYRATGRDDVKPADARRFDLSDAVFYPTYLRGESDADSEAVILRVLNEIRIGDSLVTEFLARADRVEARLNALEDYVATHEHYYTAPAIPASPAPTSKALGGGMNFVGPEDPTAPATAAGATASDKVKGE